MRMRYLYFLIAIVFVSCQANKNEREAKNENYDLEKVNVGEVKVFADYNSKYLLEQLGSVYSAHFPKAFLNVSYREDTHVMDAIYADSVRLIVLMRECSSGELSKLKSLYQAKPLQYTFAYDAIALVRDAANTDTILDSLQLNKWLINGSDVFVGTKEHAGMFSHLLRQKGVTEGNRSLNIVNSIDDLQAYLKLHPQSVGILPFSLVSDQYNPTAKDITSKFSWLEIKGTSGQAIYPSQSTIYTKEWPFVIPYTILYCNLPSEKGVGFVKFVHTRQAAKLIVKSGLIPFSMPERSVKVEDQSFEL